MANFFPAPAYRFIVSIDGDMKEEAAFQEVSGLEAEMEVEEVPAGGVNNFVYRLPKRTKFNNLVLKRGLFRRNTKLLNMIKDILLSESNLNKKIKKPKILTVKLQDEKGKPVMTWSFKKPYPVKISMSNLNAQENAIAVETIEFAHQGFIMY